MVDYTIHEHCPKCNSHLMRKRVQKYCFQDDTNPIDCVCLKCGYKWEERS